MSASDQIPSAIRQRREIGSPLPRGEGESITSGGEFLIAFALLITARMDAPSFFFPLQFLPLEGVKAMRAIANSHSTKQPAAGLEEFSHFWRQNTIIAYFCGFCNPPDTLRCCLEPISKCAARLFPSRPPSSPSSHPSGPRWRSLI